MKKNRLDTLVNSKIKLTSAQKLALRISTAAFIGSTIGTFLPITDSTETLEQIAAMHQTADNLTHNASQYHSIASVDIRNKLENLQSKYGFSITPEIDLKLSELDKHIADFIKYDSLMKEQNISLSNAKTDTEKFIAKQSMDSEYQVRDSIEYISRKIRSKTPTTIEEKKEYGKLTMYLSFIITGLIGFPAFEERSKKRKIFRRKIKENSSYQDNPSLFLEMLKYLQDNHRCHDDYFGEYHKAVSIFSEITDMVHEKPRIKVKVLEYLKEKDLPISELKTLCKNAYNRDRGYPVGNSKDIYTLPSLLVK